MEAEFGIPNARPLILGCILWRTSATDLDRLPQPILNVALLKEKTAFVLEPMLGRFSRELPMPSRDFGVTSRAQRGSFPQPSHPITAKARIFDTTAVAALEKRHCCLPKPL